MKNSARSALVLACLLGLLPGSWAMDNGDLIKMKKAGLSDETLLLAIGKEKPDFDTSPSGLVELKEGGISEPLIQKLMALPAGVRTPGTSSVPPATVSEPPAAVIMPAASAAVTAGPTDNTFYQEFPAIAPPTIQPTAGSDYFTRFSLHEEKDTYITTNYARGTVIPINTPVKLLSVSKNKLLLKRLDTGAELKVDNVEKYTLKSANEFASLLLATTKTPLEKLPPAVANAVSAGEMRKGMTKELVLMARGYPPAHETPSVENDRWVYWSSRFVKQTVVFTNGRLSEGRGLY